MRTEGRSQKFQLWGAKSLPSDVDYVIVLSQPWHDLFAIVLNNSFPHKSSNYSNLSASQQAHFPFFNTVYFNLGTWVIRPIIVSSTLTSSILATGGYKIFR